MQIKEINLYSIGDSASAKTWSNVPYFFSRQLEIEGIRVNRINIEENPVFSKIYRYSLYPILKLFYPATQHNFFRSRTHHWFIGFRIKKALKDFPGADLQVFMSFSFSSKPYSPSPCILFGDWTYLYLIGKLQKRKVFWFEKNALKREAEHIQQADLVISLFPKSNQHLGETFRPKKHLYLGNVVNSTLRMGTQELLRQKLNSRLILFIGNRKYLHAAKNLLAAFELLSLQHFPGTELHFIGLNTQDLGELPFSVFAHGYQNKSIDSENKRYYELLCKARVIVNSQEDWGAFSSLTEAMYYGTPVICSPFEEFTETYGDKIDFGTYLRKGTKEELVQKLQELLAMQEEAYTALVLNARDKTKNFTWENFTRNFLEQASKLNGQEV